MAAEGIWKNVEILGVSFDRTNSMRVLVKENSVFERKFLYTLERCTGIAGPQVRFPS